MSDSNSRNNNLYGFQKFTTGYGGGFVSVGDSFLRHDKWQIKLISAFFTIHILHFMNDSNSRNNNSCGFKNSQMNMGRCAW